MYNLPLNRARSKYRQNLGDRFSKNTSPVALVLPGCASGYVTAERAKGRNLAQIIYQTLMLLRTMDFGMKLYNDQRNA
jgi:hypothetical protein